LAGKPRFFEQSENQGHCDDPAFPPEFSKRNSGSSFFEWRWTAGSMSHLDGEVELQTRSLKMDVRVEIPLGLASCPPAQGVRLAIRSNLGGAFLSPRDATCCNWKKTEDNRRTDDSGLIHPRLAFVREIVEDLRETPESIFALCTFKEQKIEPQFGMITDCTVGRRPRHIA
jgi:hypothetical protein